MKTNIEPCPECAGLNLYTTEVTANGGYGPVLLPGLGGIFTPPRFRVVVCSDCGLTRFFAERKACDKLRQHDSKHWLTA